MVHHYSWHTSLSFLAVCVSLLRLLRFLVPRLPHYLLHGSLNLWVIVAVMTYLARRSAPSNVNKHKEKCALIYGQADTAMRAYAGGYSPLPPMSQRTDWRQGRRLPSLLLLPAFLPPSINQTSLTLHLHYDGCLSPTCLIISSSFTSPGCPLFLHSSLPPLCSFSSRKFTWLALCLHLYLYFIRGFHSGKRHPTGCLLKKEAKGRTRSCSCF